MQTMTTVYLVAKNVVTATGMEWPVNDNTNGRGQTMKYNWVRPYEPQASNNGIIRKPHETTTSTCTQDKQRKYTVCGEMSIDACKD